MKTHLWIIDLLMSKREYIYGLSLPQINFIAWANFRKRIIDRCEIENLL